MGKLTVKALESLTEKDIGRKLFDGSGLRGHVSKQKTGIVVRFFYRFSQQNKTREAMCGIWPKISLRHIRTARDKIMQLVIQGIDPIEQKKSEVLKKELDLQRDIQNKKKELSHLASQQKFADAIEQWATLELIRRKDKGKEALRSIQKDILPKLGDLALADVNRQLLMQRFDAVVSRGARIMANHLFSDLKQFYNFAIAREWVEKHPLTGLSKEKIGGRQKERDRYLVESEIIELKNQLPVAKLTKTTHFAIWIMLSSCCRVGELSQARWEELNLTNKTWTIPTKNSKNAKEHTIFLSPFTIRYFQQLYDLTGHTQWCFPAKDNQSHICPKSITKQIKDRTRQTALKNRSQATGVLLLSQGAWTPHDLRRTGATMMGEMGIMGEVIERCLNHVEQNKLKRIYQRHELKNEQREAWHKLGNRLQQLIG